MAVEEYPGTAFRRLNSVHERVQSLASDPARPLHGAWGNVRRHLLWAGGLKDLPNARPGQGYTGHSFNDYNHVDLTTMNDEVSANENDGSVKGIAIGNRLGDGIKIASLPELGPGGSWSTCQIGCQHRPPQDVAHIQFRSKIAFKLVWVPNEDVDPTFVLVDDDGALLASGIVSSANITHGERVPSRGERLKNWSMVRNSKYGVEAQKIADQGRAEECSS